MTIRQSSVTQLLETLRTRNSLNLGEPPKMMHLRLLGEVQMLALEDAENVYRRAMMHAEDIERAELVQDMWELERIPA